MFKQFVQNFAESQVYLISSLWLFFIFFILVALMLWRMTKNHTEYMSQLPLLEDEENTGENLQGSKS